MVDLLNALAVTANQMMVVRVPVQFIFHAPVSQIRQIDETELG